MPALQPMPRLELPTATLLDFGGQWTVNGGALSRTQPHSSGELGNVIDRTVGDLATYVRQGEAAAVHTGYKCSIRTPWWRAPSVWIPEAFMLRQIHRHPKIVVNDSHATTTDTVHRLRVRPDVSPRRLAASFFNSATFAFCEAMGWRHPRTGTTGGRSSADAAAHSH